MPYSCLAFPFPPSSHHSLQTLYSKHLSELQGDLQVTRFEKERTGLVHQETIKGIRQLQLEQEKLQKKVIGLCYGGKIRMHS